MQDVLVLMPDEKLEEKIRAYLQHHPTASVAHVTSFDKTHNEIIEDDDLDEDEDHILYKKETQVMIFFDIGD